MGTKGMLGGLTCCTGCRTFRGGRQEKGWLAVQKKYFFSAMQCGGHAMSLKKGHSRHNAWLNATGTFYEETPYLTFLRLPSALLRIYFCPPSGFKAEGNPPSDFLQILKMFLQV